MSIKMKKKYASVSGRRAGSRATVARVKRLQAGWGTGRPGRVMA